MALSRDALAGELRQLGLRAGDAVMVHASLRKLGPVEGRADGVLDALRLALGPEGTVLMVIAADDSIPFDRLATPAHEEMGVLAEILRQREGVELADHPACRFAAWGPLAREFTRDQPWHDYYGPGSTLERLVDAEGRVLRLGADIDTVTLTHWAEYLADLPHKTTVRRHYTLAEGGRVAVDSLDDSEGIVDWPHGDYFAELLRAYLEDPRVRRGRVGGCEAELFDSRPFVDFAVAWMERELQ